MWRTRFQRFDSFDAKMKYRRKKGRRRTSRGIEIHSGFRACRENCADFFSARKNAKLHILRYGCRRVVILIFSRKRSRLMRQDKTGLKNDISINGSTR